MMRLLMTVLRARTASLLVSLARRLCPVPAVVALIPLYTNREAEQLQQIIIMEHNRLVRERKAQ